MLIAHGVQHFYNTSIKLLQAKNISQVKIIYDISEKAKQPQ